MYKKYNMTKDPQLLGVSPLLTTMLGIKKAITYNAITVMK